MKNAFTNHFSNLKKHWKDDLFAGFTVFFVAFPLALGIALASGMSASAGIISALIGGLIIGHFNGAYVTINGPPKATIIVILSAVAFYGGTNGGVEVVLAIFCVSGIAMFMFGLFRFGELGDFFPSSSIQGMLAAIGLMIILNQIHAVFGVNLADKSTLTAFLELPSTLMNMNPYVAVVGISSLAFLFAYPYLDAKLLKSIPAPMWVVLYASLMAYLLNYGTSRTYIFNNQLFDIGPQFLLSIPKNFLSDLPSPDFSKVVQADFWVFAFNITLIASLESLLAAKAIDKLDPQRRSTNLNQNLMATGGGTVLSSFLGGLPIVSLILASTVNLSNGGKTKWSNFFHALIIALLAFFATFLLNRIPLAALAAILVHTGFKLTAPRAFIRAWNVGKEQLAVFIVTMLGTLVFDLVLGIVAGIITTLIIHLFSGVDKNHLFGFLFKSTNHFHYDESDDHFYVSVRRFANFFNYLGLKKQLNKIPSGRHVILDFSHAKFVDHTVMEHISNYAEQYRSKSGIFEVIGLDLHHSYTNHPLASRRIIEGVRPDDNRNLNITKRQRQLKRISYSKGWTFNIETDWDITYLRRFPFFATKSLYFRTNVVEGEIEGEKFNIADVSFAQGALEDSVDYRMSIMVQNLKTRIPKFSIEKEFALDKVLQLAGKQDIDFAKFPEFSSKFLLRGEDEVAIRKLFTKDLILFFETHSVFHIECTGDEIMLFDENKLAKPHEVEVYSEFIKQLWKHIQ